jgi:hypothetical protein
MRIPLLVDRHALSHEEDEKGDAVAANNPHHDMRLSLEFFRAKDSRIQPEDRKLDEDCTEQPCYSTREDKLVGAV